jgi:hypothetical protein
MTANIASGQPQVNCNEKTKLSPFNRPEGKLGVKKCINNAVDTLR